jgi:hypothetical protein
MLPVLQTRYTVRYSYQRVNYFTITNQLSIYQIIPKYYNLLGVISKHSISLTYSNLVLVNIAFSDLRI